MNPYASYLELKKKENILYRTFYFMSAILQNTLFYVSDFIPTFSLEKKSKSCSSRQCIVTIDPTHQAGVQPTENK